MTEGPEPEPDLGERLRRLEAENRRLREDLRRVRAHAAELEGLAHLDPLTQLPNRRGFARELGLMMALARRYKNTGAVIYFDVNNLKRINDGYGHAAGDAVICHVANVLAGRVRASDVVARLGGDEFAVLLQQAGREAAEAKARELIDAVQAAPVDVGAAQVTVRLAYGVSVFSGEESPDEAVQAADQAMYVDKRRTTSRA